jgi:hypothetical protein
MSRAHALAHTAVALALGAGALGCGAELDPQSELSTLRVLAVQKDKPYASPGDTVNMTMLFHDASDEAGRRIEIGWFSGCVNPPGDLYQGCFGGAIDPSALKVVQGDALTTFSFPIPANIIEVRPPAPGNQPRYGLAIVFFAACAGTLSFDFTTRGFPILCLNEAGRPLGSDDFVAGYSTVYVFDGFENQNPLVTGISFRGTEAGEDHMCLGEECTLPADPPTDFPPELTVPACPDDGDPVLCQEYPLKPIVDRATAELDSVTAAAYGHNYTEQVWASYFTTGGGFRSDTRLLNDATRGWNDDYGADFFAPKDPGPVRLFATVRDNRGGVAWVGLDINVE